MSAGLSDQSTGQDTDGVKGEIMGETQDALAADEAERKKRTFERSLAGPSVGKAGLQMDQTEINHVIAEASKGSKFYNNQLRKNEDLDRKIEWFQNKRDELMKMAQSDLLEAEADRILSEVEASRDLTQAIVHVDMDAFYASVEVKRDPSLRGKPFGVGGGVLTTASYEARKYGCRSGMAGFIAKKLCPQIILVPLNFDLYIDASDEVRKVLLEYDANLMMASLDEGYLNITQYTSTHGLTASEVVEQLRDRVVEATGLTVSAGIAPNRMLAKICSDKNKPNGQFELEFQRATITRFMRDLPVRKIPGFGRVTERCLEGLGVETCGDIWAKRTELLVMDHWFGFRGLCKAYLGIGDNKVEPGKREERKSVGCERTFRDKTQDEDILETLVDIANELGKDLERLQYAGKTVTVKYKLHTFENKTRAQSVKKYISKTEEILPIARELLKRDLPLRIRLLGIRLSTLKDLTVSEKGIQNYFSPAIDDDEDDVVLLEDDDSDAGPSNLMKRKERSDSPKPRLGPTCPICNHVLEASTSNTELNKHIDRCLTGGLEEATPPESRSDRAVMDVKSKRLKRAGDQREASPMLKWLTQKR